MTGLLEDGLVRVPEAARLLGLSRSKVYALIEAGELPFAKFGISRRIPRRALAVYVRQHLVGPADLVEAVT